MGGIVPFEHARTTSPIQPSTVIESVSDDEVSSLAFPDVSSSGSEQPTPARRGHQNEPSADSPIVDALSQPLNFEVKPTFEDEDEKSGAGKKKGNTKKNRKLVYDDETGRMVTKKQRKRRNAREDDWRDLYG